MQKRLRNPAEPATQGERANALSRTWRRRVFPEYPSARAPRGRRPSRSSRLRWSILATVMVMAGVGIVGNPARAAVDVVSPALDEAVPAGPLRVVLRLAGDVRDLRVSLDGKEVTRRLRAQSDRGRRRARLGTIRAVRAGRHHLEVSWRDARGRRHSVSRRVLVGRRAKGLLRVVGPAGRVRGSAKRNRMQVSGLVRFRLRVSRGVKHVRLRVNGRVVRVPVSAQTKPVRQVALGTRQGVRFGVNRIQVAASRPRDLAYDREMLSVAVRRDRPLLSGLTKFAGMAGAPARLDARGGRSTAPGRRLQYRWRVVSRPPGSQAALRRASSPTPTMRAARSGRYRLRLAVSERRPGGAPTGRDKAAIQRVTVDMTPDPVPLAGAWLETLPPGVPADANELLGAIKVGEALYPTPDIRSFPYLLVLDLRTLAPLNLDYNGAATKITARDGHSPPLDDDVRDAVRRAVANSGDDPVLAVIAFAGRRLDASTSIINLKAPSSYVFTPALGLSNMGISAGWSRESDPSNPVAKAADISGWLAPRYPGQGDDDPGPPGPLEFSPAPLVPYDTHVGAGTGTNTMEIGGKSYAATLPQGASDGFHVLVADSMANVLENRAFAAGDAGAIAAMSDFLAGVGPNRTVLVQSIGSPRRSGASWNGLADRLRALGGTPDVLLRLGEATPAKPTPQDPSPGAYALVTATGPDAQPDQGKPAATVAEASIVNSGGQAPGELAGALRPVGRWMALAPAVQGWGGDSSAAALWALAQAPPTDFPALTSDDELQALKTIASYSGDGSDLYRTGGNSCYPQLTTLPPQLLVRASYCNTKLNGWRTWSATLSGWAKEGSQLPAGYKGNPATFRAVAAQLAREFVDLAATRDGFNDIRVAIANAKIDVFANLQADQNALAELIREADAIPGGHDSVFGAVGLGREILSLVGLFPEVGEVAEVFSAIIGISAESLELAEGEGNPMERSSVPPAAIQREIATQFTDLSVGLAVAQDRLASDPRKLGRAGDNFAGVNQDPADPYSANWSTSGFQQSRFDALMRRGAQRYLAPAYISAIYTAWQTYTLNKLRRPDDVGGITCRASDGVNYWNPFPFYPADASYLPLDRDVPTMSWTLVRRVTQGVDVWLHNNPWNSTLKPEDPHDNRLAWEVKRDNAPPTSLLSLLFGPKRYNIPKSWFFPHGLQSVAGPLSEHDFSSVWRCGWP
jgi:hypothetical protein